MDEPRAICAVADDGTGGSAWEPPNGPTGYRKGEVVTFDTLHHAVSPAVIVFDFDPYVRLFGDLVVRWSAVALTGVIVLALVLAGILARAGDLRADDVAFIAVGIVPGAVVGGRLGFALLHWPYVSEDPSRLLDPGLGGMELGLAVVGGLLTGAYVASLLGAPLGRWLHLAAAPVLFALGAGKLTMVLGGSGQGLPSGATWATAYLGPGPWGSLLPALPSHPSQAYEGIATLAILALLALALMVGAFRRRDGRLFFLGVGLWAVARVFVSTTWRDPVVAAGLGAGGLIAAGIAAGCLLAFVVLTLRRPRAARVEATEPAAEVAAPIPGPALAATEPAAEVAALVAPAVAPGPAVAPTVAATEPAAATSGGAPGSDPPVPEVDPPNPAPPRIVTPVVTEWPVPVPAPPEPPAPPAPPERFWPGTGSGRQS
jgi:prolipoprotein diacylglyceryltransferase